MMSSKNNGFTAGDIERYHSGKMPPEERHALEKAALDDPFLADALEGYAFTSTPTADLAKIQLRLDKKKDQKKVVPLFQKYKWLSVAALFIIIAGTGWLVYDLQKKENQPSIAVQKEKGSEQNSDNTMPNQKITIDSSIHSTTSTAEKPNKKQQGVSSRQRETEVNQNLTTEQKQENVVVSNSRNNQSNAYFKKEANSNSERRLSVPQDQTANNGRYRNAQAVDINRNKTAVQKTNDIASNNISRTDGLYKDINADKPAARVRGIEQNDTVKHFDIVLQSLPKDSQPAMQEVVIVGYGAQNKSMEKYPKVTIDTLEPAEGYVKFDDYVISNLKMPEELKTKTLAGEVQLSFDVDQNGQPVNITVEKSLCEKCDEEAIRLLKEGPKWKKKKNKKGKITIKF
jgi:outer membrane biosynthesis protein TonB